MGSQAADMEQETRPNQDWDDENKHQRLNVCSDRHVKVHTAVVNGLFNLDQKSEASRLVDYCDPVYRQRRNLLVVIDGQLPESMRMKAEAYFEWCKTTKFSHFRFLQRKEIGTRSRLWSRSLAN